MRAWMWTGVATLLSVAFVVVLRVPGLSDTAVLVVSDVGQLLAAAAAAVACALTARRSAERRRAWTFLALGTGSWALGEAVWTYYEVVLGTEVPFPSLADVGFLGFPLASAVGLVWWLGAQNHELVARGRDVLDGALIAGSLLVLSWVTALSSAVADGGDSWSSVALSMAYPLGDVVVATLVLLALARGRGAERSTLVQLAVGLGGLAAADSAYLFLVSSGQYSSADVVSSGWVLGFLMVAAAGLDARTSGVTASPAGRGATASTWVRASRLRVTLPYVPLLVAMTVLGVSLFRSTTTSVVDLSLAAALVAIVLLRQLLAVIDNQRLVEQLEEARDQLEHQALHDALTGLANRVLFADRLDRALLQGGAELAVLYCDLDDFKLVNDELGHKAGDQLLALVAGRLTDCVRATDTVARLGGDEFAVLLESADEASDVAQRIVHAMAAPHRVGDHIVTTSVSIGVARHVVAPSGSPVGVEQRRAEEVARRTVPAGTRATTGRADDRLAAAQALVHSADSAMYAAKGAGKGRAVLAETGRVPTGQILGSPDREETPRLERSAG